MHSVHFAMRRAFHKSWQRGMAITKKYGLTPARVDLLHALRDQEGHSLRQRELRRRLGITSPALSKLVAKVEKCGLVRRMVSPHDRRRNDVALTKLGQHIVDLFFAEVIEPGVARRDVESFVAVDGGDEHARRVATDAFRLHLLRMRRKLGDVGTIWYREPPARRAGDNRPLKELIDDAYEVEFDEAWKHDFELPDGTVFVPHDPSHPPHVFDWLSFVVRGGISGLTEAQLESWFAEHEAIGRKLGS
jgi:DNA-binding MarR family transcriptional regulator